MVHEASLRELVNSGCFSIQNASVVEIDERKYVRIDFTGDFNGHGIEWKIRNDAIVRSHVILDPENYWIIKAAAVYDETNTGIVAEYFADLDGPVPVPVRYYSIWDYNLEGGGWMEGPTEETYRFHFEHISLFDFWLSAYGIDEPDGEYW